jgi:hypothetical protein
MTLGGGVRKKRTTLYLRLEHTQKSLETLEAQLPVGRGLYRIVSSLITHTEISNVSYLKKNNFYKISSHNSGLLLKTKLSV